MDFPLMPISESMDNLNNNLFYYLCIDIWNSSFVKCELNSRYIPQFRYSHTNFHYK